MSEYFWGVLRSFDRFVNALTGGSEYETISHRWQDHKDRSKVAEIGCKILDEIDNNHCEDAPKSDKT